jgi:hypothetical protein
MNSNVRQWLTAQSAVALAETHAEFETLSASAQSAVGLALDYATSAYVTGQLFPSSVRRQGLVDQLISDGFSRIAAESAVDFAVNNSNVT